MTEEKAQPELLKGGKAIARVLFGNDSQTAQSRVSYIKNELPIFRVRRTLYAYRKDLEAYLITQARDREALLKTRAQEARDRAAKFIPFGEKRLADSPKGEAAR